MKRRQHRAASTGRQVPDLQHERSAQSAGFLRIAGIDEAGRGPWAGPVIAAAVVLEPSALPATLRDGLDDSKRLSRQRRERLFAVLTDCTAVRFGVGKAEVAEIDDLNILGATMLAMQRAVAELPGGCDLALVDGNRPPALSCAVRCVVGGDGLSLSIAAASIVAKVTRDRLMAELDVIHPGYGWSRNAGYGTAEHQRALATLGVTCHHRRSFAPILKILSQGRS